MPIKRFVRPILPALLVAQVACGGGAEEAGLEAGGDSIAPNMVTGTTGAPGPGTAGTPGSPDAVVPDTLE